MLMMGAAFMVSYESLDIMVFNTADIAQFEFTITDTLDLITLTGASGGLADENNFVVSTSEEGTVVGVSLSDGTIPIGEGTLTNLNFSYSESGSTEVCITNQTFSDINGNEILVPGDSCTSLELDTELAINDSIENVEFGISNIYPNPFNPLINFDIELLKTEAVDITIYDITGNKVSIIHSGLLNQGTHSFYWDAKNQATGIYIIQCKNDNSVSTQKILLMK